MEFVKGIRPSDYKGTDLGYIMINHVVSKVS